MSSLPIHERFYTWQGEGVHMGRSAFFIRTFGCPVKCPWCDSAGTWHPKYIPDHIERLDVPTLVSEAKACNPDFVVITGGEPAIHDLSELVKDLHAQNLPVHLETSGAFQIKGDFDWITLSPKWWKMPLSENLRGADEFKIIVDQENAIDRWANEIQSYLNTDHVWLHPEWSRKNDPLILNTIATWVKTHGRPYRAGYQLHKLYNVDSLDTRSKPLTPLGGNELLGY